MTTMTDEAAKKIAESTIRKYNNAGRNALIFISGNNNTSAAVCSNMDGEDAIEAALGLVYELAGDLAETVFKDAAKQAKQLRKEETKKEKKHGSKH